MSSNFLHQQLAAPFTQVLGVNLTNQELVDCCNLAEIQAPEIAKLFWQSLDAEPGIYLVLQGKLRLLDTSNNLIATLSARSSFGEITLFPQTKFQPYSARASTNLTLCYLGQNLLHSLFCKYPDIQEHLYHQAEIWDLLLLCVQNSQFPRIISVEKMLKVLSLLQAHNLGIGSLPTEFTINNKFWLLRQGEMLRSDGLILTPGKIYVPTSEAENWQIIKPTIAYILQDSDWQTALDYLPQLAEFITLDSVNYSELRDEIERIRSG